MMDFNKNWIKSVQFRENGDNILHNLAKNRENTENYHVSVLRIGWKWNKGGKLCHKEFYPPPLW